MAGLVLMLPDIVVGTIEILAGRIAPYLPAITGVQILSTLPLAYNTFVANDPSYECGSNPSLCTFTVDGQRYLPDGSHYDPCTSNPALCTFNADGQRVDSEGNTLDNTCETNPSLCTYNADGRRIDSEGNTIDNSCETNPSLCTYDADGNRIGGRAKRDGLGFDTIPALFGFDTTNVTESDIGILKGMVVDSLPDQSNGKATFRNDEAGFEAEGVLTGVQTIFGGGIKHGKFFVPLGGKDHGTARGNWVVVDFSKLDDNTSAAFSDLFDVLSKSPMDMLKLLEAIHPRTEAGDQK